MKIAIPTNDRVNIAERTGRAKEFAIIDIIGDKFEINEFKKNEHDHHHEHGESHSTHSHSDLIEILNGVSAVVVKKVGQHLKTDLDMAKIDIVLTKHSNIDDCIKGFIENK